MLWGWFKLMLAKLGWLRLFVAELNGLRSIAHVQVRL